MRPRDISISKREPKKVYFYSVDTRDYAGTKIPRTSRIKTIVYTQRYSTSKKETLVAETVDVSFVEGLKLEVSKIRGTRSYTGGLGRKLRALPDAFRQKVLGTLPDSASALLQYVIEQDDI